MRRPKTASQGNSGGSFWLSFSDMMSVLVLIFIFVIFSMMFTVNEQEEKVRASQQELEHTILILQDTENELDSVKGELEDSKTTIVDLRSNNQALRVDLSSALTERDAAVSERDAALTNAASLSQQVSSLNYQIGQKQSEIDYLSGQYNSLLLSSQSYTQLLTERENQIALYESQITSLKTQLEQMLGVKTQIIRSLSEAFRRNNIQVEVDEDTGAITLPGAALFDSGKVELKAEGMRSLDRFLPVYLSVLLSDEFRPYVAEIIIEGHTDSTARTGSDAFLFNLELSQQRALAVASYVLDDSYMRYTLRLSDAKIAAFKKVISAAGRSFSALKYYPNGTEDKESSRRVEIKFSLIDEESVFAMQQIIGK